VINILNIRMLTVIIPRNLVSELLFHSSTEAHTGSGKGEIRHVQTLLRQQHLVVPLVISTISRQWHVALIF